jgi:hypothetical protein
MANVIISQLPLASALTGAELVPIQQNGNTVQTTTSAIAVQPTQTQPFLTVGQQTSLANSRQISVSTGLTFTDGGAQGSYTIAVTGALSSLVNSGNGIQVKTNSTTLTNVSIASSGVGVSIANADGTAGNPTISLSSILQNLVGTSTSGFLSLTSGSFSTSSSTGTGSVVLAVSPALTGTPTAPTATTGTNTTQIATTAFVTNAISASGGGSVTTVSVASANGFVGSVANASSTPAITISTSITGLLQGNGTAISAVTIGSGLNFASGTLSSTGSGGTVTSVGFTGGLITVASATTTPALTVAGTSGGIVYFSSASTWASSALLASNALMIGGGAGSAPSTTTTGTGVVSALAVNTGTAGAFVVNGGALGTPTSGTVTNLTGTASININGTVGATTASTGAFTYISTSGFTSTTPVLTFNASNSPIASGASISGSYLQFVMQNKSATVGASTNYVLSNDSGTDSSYYGEFGMNSTVYSTSTPSDFFSINNGIYFSGHDGDVSVGAGTSNKTYLTFAAGVSAHVINNSGAIGLSTNLGTTPALSGTTGFGTSGQVLTSAGSAAAPTWTTPNASTVTLVAGTGATNYLTFSATATGNQPLTTNSSLTYNYTNNALTAGVNGGTF